MTDLSLTGLALAGALGKKPAASNDSDNGSSAVADISLWVPEWLQMLMETMQGYPWVLALALLLIGYLVARLSQWICSRVLTRLTKRTDNELDDHFFEMLSRPVFTTIMLLTVVWVILALGLESLPFRIGIRVLYSLILLSWTLMGLRAAGLLLRALGHAKHHFEIIQDRTIPLFDILSKVFIVGASVYGLFLVWGIDPTAWLASAGIIGIAVGFAAKDTLANLFSGVFIVADAPYKLGDYIVLDTGERGMVSHVGLRSTRLLTRDDIEVTIPNAVIGNAKIVNESGGPWQKERIRIAVGVAYGSDVDQVCEVLEQVAKDHEHIEKHPAPRVRMRGFGASSLDFELLCWIDLPEQRGKLAHELYMDVYKAFNAAGIEIPFSQHDLYIKSWPGRPPETED